MLKIGALAVGGLAAALGGFLYLQYRQENMEIEALMNDIYTLEQMMSYLEDELYNSFPIYVELCRWVPSFIRQLQVELQGQKLSQEQFVTIMIN